MRRGLGGRYVTDELRDDVGSDPLVHQDLEVAWTHRSAPFRIDRDDPFGKLRIKVGGHLIHPADLAQWAGKDKHLERLSRLSGELDCFRRTDVDTVCCFHRD